MKDCLVIVPTKELPNILQRMFNIMDIIWEGIIALGQNMAVLLKKCQQNVLKNYLDVHDNVQYSLHNNYNATV